MKHKWLLYLLLLVIISSCSVSVVKNPAIIELIDTNYSFSTDNFNLFCKENNIRADQKFQWENHWVIYADKTQIEPLALKLEQNYPRLKINLYNEPFYNFNREKSTGEKPASEWEHIIMTANLVQDTILQNEYMEYHRTQFEKWPEISKGFCNADFQQLLVFRNGRQLMLVISIPKGKTLDELNPKTTENNPRVNEWNKIMANYQEGIEDAPKGSTWVEFTAP